MVGRVSIWIWAPNHKFTNGCMDNETQDIEDTLPRSDSCLGPSALGMAINQLWPQNTENCPGTEFGTYEGSEYFDHGPWQEILRSTSLSKIIGAQSRPKRGPKGVELPCKIKACLCKIWNMGFGPIWAHIFFCKSRKAPPGENRGA